VAPAMQFVLGVLVFDEQMSPGRWVGFALVWLALVVITVESLVNGRRIARAARRDARDPIGDSAGSVC
jgi:chloramphenicol-sensitive protein RarD